MPDNADNADTPTRRHRRGMPRAAEAVSGSGDCPSEVKRLPGREYLAARNQAKLTIKRSGHRVVREIAAIARERRNRHSSRGWGKSVPRDPTKAGCLPGKSIPRC